MVNRLFVAILYIFLVAPASAVAQRTIGIDWQVPSETSEIAADLRHFSDLGITHLQIEQELDNRTWQLINELDFTVFGKLPIHFAVTQTFSKADSIFATKMQNLAAHYEAKDAVQAIGIFSVGAQNDETFHQALSSFTGQLSDETKKPFYYIAAHEKSSHFDDDFNFRITLSGQTTAENKSRGYLYKPLPDLKWELAAAKAFLERTSSSPQDLIFFESSWLKGMENRHPGFAQTLTFYATSADPVFPLPQMADQKIGSNTIVVVMLLLAWVIFGATYNYNPVYRKSFLRYFTGHKFFVDDVMQRHIRALFTGFSILIQHGISGGIVLYCLFHTVFSPLGYEALYTHYPVLAVFGSGAFGLFVWGFLFAMVTEAISILWLWIVNPATKYISQIINLYPWLLQLNLIIATLIAALFLPGGNNISIYLFTGLFIVIFISSFILTSLDTVKHVTSKQGWVYAGTIGGYAILLIGIVIWVIFSPKLQNVVELAALLP